MSVVPLHRGPLPIVGWSGVFLATERGVIPIPIIVALWGRRVRPVRSTKIFVAPRPTRTIPRAFFAGWGLWVPGWTTDRQTAAFVGIPELVLVTLLGKYERESGCDEKESSTETHD